MNPRERFSTDVCSTPSSTPVESPSPTDPTAVDNVAVIVSTVVIGIAALLATLVVIATVALIVTHKKHKKTKQKLM